MLENRIAQHFIDSADLKYQAAQSLSAPLALCVQAILACVTSGSKVLACGNGGAAANAQHFVAEFQGRFERERPELAALSLGVDAASVTAIATDYDFSQIFARQVRALGQAGDVLLVLSSDGQEPNLREAVQAAHEREMTVLAFTGKGGGALQGALLDTDVHICVPSERAARVHEVHLLALHCLCDGVDNQLLGEAQEVMG